MTRTIVLLPGLHGTGDLFEPLLAVAPPDVRPVVIPLPPIGTYAELFEYLRVRLPAEGKFVVMGESFSGPLAIEIAKDQPERVAAVILSNSFVSPPRWRLFRFLPWSLLFSIPPPKWVVRWFFVGRRAPDEVVTAVRNAIANTPRRILAARMREVFSLPEPDGRSGIAAPLLALTGSLDAFVTPDTSELHRIAKTVVIREIAAPHLLLQGAPQAAWSEIIAFLADHVDASISHTPP